MSDDDLILPADLAASAFYASLTAADVLPEAAPPDLAELLADRRTAALADAAQPGILDRVRRQQEAGLSLPERQRYAGARAALTTNRRRTA